MPLKAHSLHIGNGAVPTSNSRCPHRLLRIRHPSASSRCRAAVTVAEPLTSVSEQQAAQWPGRLLPDGSVLYTAEELSRDWKPVPASVMPLSAEAVVLRPAPAAPAQADESAAAPSPAPPTAPVQTKPAPASSPTGAISAPKGINGIDWAARRRKKVVEEIIEAAERMNRRGTVRKGYRPIQYKNQTGTSQQYDPKRIEAGLQQLETLLPGFQLNLDALPATEWAKLALDVEGVAARLVALKAAWPGADLSAMLTVFPKALLSTPEHITREGAKVRELLKTAKNPDAIVQSIPEMLVAQQAASIIVTVNKWYGYKRDPVEVLEKDPELVQRAQAMEEPFEPVYYEEETGTWVVPGAAKVNKPKWAEQVEEIGKKRGAERQEQLKERHQAFSKSREGAGTTAFVAKSFESLE